MSEASTRPRNRWYLLTIAVLMLLSIVLAVLLVNGWLQETVVFGTFGFAVERIVDASGLSIYLVKGVLVLVLIPFFLALREVAKLPFFKPAGLMSKPVAWGIIACYISGYFLTMYFATQDTYFRHLGTTSTATKFYAVTPEGVRFFDTDGFDPKYNIKLKPATQQLIENLERAKRGDVAKPLVVKSISDITFFDTLTGEATVWYGHSLKNEIQLFSAKGFNPETGEELEPVTREVVAGIKQQLNDTEANHQQANKAQEADAKATEANIERRRVESEEQVFRSRYVNSLPPRAPDQTVVGLLLMEEGSANPALREALTLALKERGVEHSDGVFRKLFLEDGSAERLLGGDWSLAKRLRLSEVVNSVLFVKTSHSVTATGEIDPALRSASLNLDMKCVDVVKLRACGSGAVTVKGVGFSDAEALRNSTNKAGTEIQKFVKSLGI